jgi:hypothetical protein
MTDEVTAALAGAVVGALAGGLVSVATAWWLQSRERKARVAALHAALLGELELAYVTLNEKVAVIDGVMKGLEPRGVPHMLPTRRVSTAIYDACLAELAPELDASSRGGLHEMYERIRVVEATLAQATDPPGTTGTFENFKLRLDYARGQAETAASLIRHVLGKNGRAPVPPAPQQTSKGQE